MRLLIVQLSVWKHMGKKYFFKVCSWFAWFYVSRLSFKYLLQKVLCSVTFFFFFFLMFYFSSSFIYPSLRWPGAQAKTADVTSEVALWLGGETRAHLVLCHVPGRPLKFYSESFITKVVLFPSLSSLWLMSYCLSLLSIWSLSVWWSRSICRVQISFFFLTDEEWQWGGHRGNSQNSVEDLSKYQTLRKQG